MTFEEPSFSRISTNGITLNVAEAGPVDGPLVVLLHGFPEFWYGWRHQIGALAGAGYRVLVPDQRGYNLSDKPRGVGSYGLESLTGDLIGLIDASGRERASVVGHDWGGVVAWDAITRFPGRFDRAVILDAPHPVAMSRALKGDLGQILRSWYAISFRVPRLPEKALSLKEFRALARGMEQSSRPGTFSTVDLERYKRAWSEPGALTSMIHWYRANFRAGHRDDSEATIGVPTLLICGTKDKFLGPGLARASYALCESARLEWIEDATHWVQHEEPDRVNQLTLAFLDEGRATPA